MKIVTPLLLVLSFLFSQKTIQAQRVGCGTDHITNELMENDVRFSRTHREFLKSIPERAAAQNRSAVAPIIRIPVVVHVIHDGEAIGTGQNLSEARIQAQIDVMNDDFNAMHPTFSSAPARWADDIGNAEIQYCLASIDPQGNPTNGITRHEIEVTGTNLDNDNIETDIKPATYWPTNDYFNIYTLPIPGTTAGGGTTGYAYFPSSAGQIRDGAVVDYRWFGGPGFGQSGYGTLTHEAGHYLGLPHPFSGESCSADDGIADTPNIDHPSGNVNCNNGWPTGEMSCGNEAMYINFMDYSGPDMCVNSFTNGQISVMRETMANERLALANNATSVCSFFDYDIATVSIENPGLLACTNDDITPAITITNFGLETVTNLSIYYQINTNTPVLFNWVDNIISGETKSVSLTPFSPPVPTYDFKVWIENPNGNIDENTVNDTLTLTSNILSPINLPLNEGFEGAAFNPAASGIFVSNPDGDEYEWQRSPDYGGLGTSSASAVFSNWDADMGIGKLDALITPVYEFNDPTETTLSYDYAYSYYPGAVGQSPNYDSLIIAVSIDCGNTFSEIVYRDGGQTMATTQPYLNPFTPFPNEWQSNSIDLSSLGNPENITVAFINKSGYGNNLYLDNIQILGACALATDLNINQISCFGECDGTVEVTTTGALGGLSYTWSNGIGGLNDATVTGLCEGDYSVTITEDGGCERIEEFSIVEPDLIAFNEVITDETSNGGNDGTITIAPTGGTVNYQLTWPAPIPAGSLSVTGLNPGVYPITLEDARGCISVLNAEVLAFDCSGFIVQGTSMDVSCNGSATGSIDIVESGGVPNIVYTWDVPGVVGANPTGLAPGPYNVTVTDDKNCEDILNFEITEPDALTLNIISTDETGINAEDGTATAIGGGGIDPFTYDWGTLGTGSMVSGIAPGTYTVTAYDGNQCPIEGSVTINAFSCDNLSASSMTTSVSCFGEKDGTSQLSTNGTNPIVYTWSEPGALGSIHLTLPAGPYSVTILDGNNCETVFNDVIEGPDEIEVTLTVDDDIICSGDATAAISSSYVGGTGVPSYLWNTASQTAANVSGLSAGYYCLTITDEEGCEGSGEVTLLDPPVLSITFAQTEPSCFGAGDGTITAIPNGGVGDYTFDWNISQANLELVGLDPGFYEITLVDENGCEIIESVTLGGPDEIIPTFTVTNETTAGANDGAIMASATGGVGNISFDWGTTIGVTPNLNGLMPGTYPVTITDATGCQIIDEVTVLSGGIDCTSLDVQITVTPVSCFGANDGMVSASASGGLEDYIYDWSNAVIGAEQSGLGPQVLILNLSDANGCEIERTIEITGPSQILPTFTVTNESAAGANDGAIMASGSGGVGNLSFDWGSPWGVTNNLSSLAPGTYPVTITDGSGCQILDEVIVGGGNIDCTGLDVIIDVTPVSCSGSSDGAVNASAFGGVEEYMYNWSNSIMTPGQIGLSAGTIGLTVTDGNGCEIIRFVTIDEPGQIVPVFTVTHESTAGANDGTIMASGSGGLGTLTFDWGLPWGITNNLNALPPGIYPVIITDEVGCQIEDEVEILAGGINCNNLDATFDIVPVSCAGFNDGMITATAFGGQENYQYDWSNTASGSSVIGLAPGPITVTITDANNCVIERTLEITEPEQLSVVISSTNETAAGANDGTISAVGSGGTGTLTYDWGTAGLGQNLTGLAPGTYNLLLSDENGCLLEESVVITAGQPGCLGFGAELFPTQVSCFNGTDGSVQAIGFGGDQDYSYVWSNSQMGPIATGLSPGPISVTVSDGNGCSITQSLILGNPDELTATTSTISASSPVTADGQASANGMGGTGTLTYTWSNSQVGPVATLLLPGVYTVTIMDELDCTIVEAVLVEGTPVDCNSFNATLQTEAAPCGSMQDGVANVSLAGAIMPVSYDWSVPGAPNSSIVNLPVGPFTVLVTNGNGCEIELSGNIDFIPGISINSFDVFETSGPGNSDGGIDLTSISGGLGNLTITWSNQQTGPTLTGLTAGSYTATITDDGDCVYMQTFIVMDGMGCSLAYTTTTEPASCNGLNDGYAEVIPQGGSGSYIYQWSNSSNQSNITAGAGTYTVTITDTDGCGNVLDVEITEPEVVGVTVLNFDGACGNLGSATAAASGGTPPFTYLWNTMDTERTITNLPAGTYSVTVTDDNNCQSNGSAVVSNDGTVFQVGNTVENVSCAGASDGSIILQINQGTPPYDVLWNTGSTDLILTGLTAGEYSVQINDGAGCNFISQYEVQSPGAIDVLFDVTNPQPDAFNGSITANVFGGQAPYSYNWSTGQNGPFIDGLGVGTYSVVITDANDCTYTESVNLGTTSNFEIDGLADWNLFPNPSNGQVFINIELATPKRLSIQVYDIRGVLMEQLVSQGMQMAEKISLDQIPAGTYFVVLRDEEGNMEREKLVVLR